MPTPTRSLSTGDQPLGEVEKRITAAMRSETQEYMLSLIESKKFLNAGDRKYTDDEVKQIRDYLYLIANIQLNNKINDLEDDEEL